MNRMVRTKGVVLSVIVLYLTFLTVSAFGGGQKAPTAEEAPVLKIGCLGVMSGAGASWGLTIKYAAETVAKMYNDQGGIEIGGTKYKIEVVSVDTKMDPRIAKTGMERLVYQENIKYIMGTCLDDTTASSQPVLESAGAVNVTYAFAKELFQAPHYNTILGMPTPYTSAPIIYEYLMKQRGVKTASFIARNDADALYERNEGLEAAHQVGLKVISSKDTYEPGTTDFFPVVTKIIDGNPDLIVLSGVAPGDAPLLIKAARELGYKGQISTETAHDTKILSEIAGDLANGFVCVGGASTPEIRSEYMEKFMKVYEGVAGEWNDEAGTKCYALQMVLYTIQEAGTAAIDDVEAFKKAIPGMAVKNPFLKEERELKYVGQKTLGHPRQIGVPLVINQFMNGDFETLMVLTEY